MFAYLRTRIVAATAAAPLALIAPSVNHKRWSCVASEDVSNKFKPISKTKDEIKPKMERILELADKIGGNEELLTKLITIEDEMWAKGRLHRIVITGGPCAGKSTVMSDVIQMLNENNYLVFTMPEIATFLFDCSQGRMWDDFAAEGPENDPVWASLQVNLTGTQMVIEDSIAKLASRSLAKAGRTEKPPNGVVILLDRGVVDNVGYCSPEAWAMVETQLGTTLARLRDERYDHVIHLVTAAYGAEKFYTLTQVEQGEGQASARTETLDEARILDDKNQEAWRGARSLHIISNTGITFDEKREKVLNVIKSKLGISQQSISQKVVCTYIDEIAVVSNASEDKDVAWVVKTSVVKTMIGPETRLMKFVHEGGSTQYFVQSLSAGSHVKSQYPVDAWTYAQKLQDIKGDSEERVTFLYKQNLVRCQVQCLADGRKELVVHVYASGSLQRLLPTWLKFQNS